MPSYSFRVNGKRAAFDSWDAGQPLPVKPSARRSNTTETSAGTNGMALAPAERLARNSKLTLEQVKTGLAGNLWRCGTQIRVLSAANTPGGRQ
jgi:aerobic-type carbon monoxide dehydrogenase small subunit (CoxS/CutS family)